MNRSYCIRGRREGEVETIDNYGKSCYRTVKDKTHAFRDGPVIVCFLTKKFDLRDGKKVCFDEKNMWCIPNNCSVFECNRLWWSKASKKYIDEIGYTERNMDRIQQLCREIGNYKDLDELLRNLDQIQTLKDILPNKFMKEYEYDKLLEEGAIR